MSDFSIDGPTGKVRCFREGQGNGPALIAVHFCGGHSGYLKGLGALGAHRQVVRYDQLGCGASDRPSSPELWTMARAVAELRDVIGAVSEQPVHLLGHSWGGLVALEVALADPQRVASLVLASTPVSIPDYETDMDRLRRELPRAVLDVLTAHENNGTTASDAYQGAVLEFRRRHLCRREPWSPEFLAQLAEANFEVFTALWGTSPFAATGRLVGYDRTASLPSVRVPVLFTAGRYDTATPERAALHRRAVAEAELAVFEHSAHMAMLEEPEAFIETLGAFLARVDASR